MSDIQRILAALDDICDAQEREIAKKAVRLNVAAISEIITKARKEKKPLKHYQTADVAIDLKSYWDEEKKYLPDIPSKQIRFIGAPFRIAEAIRSVLDEEQCDKDSIVALKKDLAKGPKRFEGLREKIIDFSPFYDLLTEKQKDAYSLAKEYGRPIAEVARRLGISRPMVEKHIASAVKAIDKETSSDNRRWKEWRNKQHRDY
jgi:hypothetical protein